MKGSYALNALKAIQEFGEFSIDMFTAFLSAGYGASIFKLEREFEKAQKERRDYEMQKYYKRKYHDLFYRLKKDGLIKKSSENKKEFFVLTAKGNKKLENLKESESCKLPDSYSYHQEQGDRFIIVIFDIPEKEKRKRDWLRAVLKRLNLKMIQKSVWTGKVKLPEILLTDLLEMKLLDYIEIFEISKTGGLKQLN